MKRLDRLKEASGNVLYSDTLTTFLYLLMRDYLPTGKVEAIIKEVVEDPEEILFTNGWLAQYAHNMADEIRNANKNNLSTMIGKVLEDLEKKEDSIIEVDKEMPKTPMDEARATIENLRASSQISQEEADRIINDINEFEKQEPQQ